MTAAQVDITLLVDNNAGRELKPEHGFSLWIEIEGLRILFDTGQGPALQHNAEVLGIQPAQADILILSHGHYDHTGGVVAAVQGNGAMDIYCHPAAVQPRYRIVNGLARAIHMPRSAMAALDKIPNPRMHWVSRPHILSDRIGLTGPIPRVVGNRDAGGAFFLDPGGRRPDPIDDDLALWIDTGRGLVICLGCCHAGLINTIDHIRRLTGVDAIAAIIGGLHLMRAPRRHIESIIAELQRRPPDAIIPCHCSGEGAAAALSKAFPGRVVRGYAGLRLVF